jgi:hypothetical protein
VNAEALARQFNDRIDKWRAGHWVTSAESSHCSAQVDLLCVVAHDVLGLGTNPRQVRDDTVEARDNYCREFARPSRADDQFDSWEAEGVRRMIKALGIPATAKEGTSGTAT